LKLQTPNSFEIGREEKLGPKMAGFAESNHTNFHDVYYYFRPFRGAL
jgi:hypothetical protein